MTAHADSAAQLDARWHRLAEFAARAAGPGWLRCQGGAIAALDRFDYTAGDDYRQIDWKLCARHDELRTLRASARR